MLLTETRKLDEKSFHDDKYNDKKNSLPFFQRMVVYFNDSLYYTTTNSFDFYTEFIKEKGSEKIVLEYGCGIGSFAPFLSNYNATVYGIDISTVAIQTAFEISIKNNLNNINYSIMDAEHLSFHDKTFDLVCGTGILHHLNVMKAYLEISRTLKDRGTAVFLEPLGYNPFINLYRRLTPGIRTRDEHPLLYSDIDIAKQYFNKVDVKYFNFITYCALPFYRLPGFKIILGTLNNIENFFFNIFPYFKRYASIIIIILEEPIIKEDC